MLIDTQGLRIQGFDAITATVLGNDEGQIGANVISQAVAHGHMCVELRDWLYCLVSKNGTYLNIELLERQGKTADRFIELIEDAFDVADEPGILTNLDETTVSRDVLHMLARAEELQTEAKKPRITDAVLSLALLESAPELLRDLLEAWCVSPALKQVLAALRRGLFPRAADRSAFDADGKLVTSQFAPSARRFLKRLTEDMAALGVEKMTSRHLLYSLLSDENSPISTALLLYGVKSARSLQEQLTRELRRLAGKRNSDFKLGRENMFDAVASVFNATVNLPEDGSAPGEMHLQLSFVMRQWSEIQRLLPSDIQVTAEALCSQLQPDEAPPEQEEPLERYSIAEIQDRINNTIFGQEHAVAGVIPWVKRLRFGIPRDGRPAGVFLFLGPTGAGKTQLAKELAHFVYGSQDELVFLEMGQFKTKESMNMFIGAPPGYVGYGEGKLTNGLRDKPTSVVLFDEIEKADPQVFDTVLRFADEGVISDPAGPVRDGQKCIIVMTTNAGQWWLRQHLEEYPDARNDAEQLSKDLFDAAMTELGERFRPEFLGRLDERITFLPFSVPTCRQIVDAAIAREIKKFQDLKGVLLVVADPVRQWIAERAHLRSLDEGARGAPRLVNSSVVTPAIDLLSDYDEQGVPLPPSLIYELGGEQEIVMKVG